jgi:hypothetical protein
MRRFVLMLSLLSGCQLFFDSPNLVNSDASTVQPDAELCGTFNAISTGDQMMLVNNGGVSDSALLGPLLNAKLLFEISGIGVTSHNGKVPSSFLTATKSSIQIRNAVPSVDTQRSIDVINAKLNSAESTWPIPESNNDGQMLQLSDKSPLESITRLSIVNTTDVYFVLSCEDPYINLLENGFRLAKSGSRKQCQWSVTEPRANGFVQLITVGSYNSSVNLASNPCKE